MLEELRIRILAKFDVGNWPDRAKIDPGTSISTMFAELARLSPQTRFPPITPRDPPTHPRSRFLIQAPNH